MFHKTSYSSQLSAVMHLSWSHWYLSQFSKIYCNKMSLYNFPVTISEYFCKKLWRCAILRDYYMTFFISALVLARDSHIKPDSKAGGLILVEGWYQGRYRKFHVIIFLSHILHWPFPSIDFYIAKRSLNWQIAKINP